MRRRRSRVGHERGGWGRTEDDRRRVRVGFRRRFHLGLWLGQRELGYREQQCLGYFGQFEQFEQWQFKLWQFWQRRVEQLRCVGRLDFEQHEFLE